MKHSALKTNRKVIVPAFIGLMVAALMYLPFSGEMKQRSLEIASLFSVSLFQGSMITPPSAGNYVFTTATNGSLTDMSSGTTTLLFGNVGDGASAISNIGFDFCFMGSPTPACHSQFSVNPNGIFRFGNVAVQTGAPFQPLGQSTAGYPLISPFASDQRTHTTGKVHFKTTGTMPNRLLVIEWLNMQSSSAAGGTADLTYQLRLYEASGVIEFVYGSMTMSAAGESNANSNDPQIGFATATGVNNLGSVAAPQSGMPGPSFNGVSATPTNNLYTAGEITVLSSPADGSRRVITFTPPIPAAPTNLNFLNTSSNSTTLNWVDNTAFENGFLVYVSSDGTNFTLNQRLGKDSTLTTVNSLSSCSNYTFRVFAVSEGGLSAPLQGSQLINGSSSTLTPASSVGALLANHTVTTTIVQNCTPVAGASVNFSITAGPNAGASGSGTTDAAGQTTFTYTSNGLSGTDTIQATTTIGTESFNATAQRTWATATFTVTTIIDENAVCDAICSLREAITAANASPGADAIAFNIPGAGPHVLTIPSANPLPIITGPIFIDGYTQPGASQNSLSIGNNAIIKIELTDNTSNTSSVSKGLQISAGNSTVRGLRIRNFDAGGVELTTNGNNLIVGNFIEGNDSVGFGGAGIDTLSTAHGNRIGGTAPAERNLISSNGEGIVLRSDGNAIQGNYIGTNTNGTGGSGNSFFNINISAGSDNNLIGGAAAGAGNVIANSSSTVANFTASGIRLDGNSNTVQGNFIGTEADGFTPRGNQSGIQIGGDNNIIGGTGAGEGNLIANSGSFFPSTHLEVGVITFTNSTGNRIRGNSIFNNGKLGLSLGNVTFLGLPSRTLVDPAPNDPCDVDTSPSGGTLGNFWQNYPLLSSVTSSGGNTIVSGILPATASQTFTLDFYANDVCDASGNGEGKTYLGSATVTTDGSCTGNFTATLPVNLTGVFFITATATDAAGNTSEFSPCFQVNSPDKILVETAVNHTDSPDPVFIGQDLTYNITVTNNLNTATGNLIVADTLPTGVTFVSASAGCSLSANVVTCNLSPLAGNASTNLSIIVRPTTTGLKTNRISLTTDALSADFATSNNTSQTDTTVNTSTLTTTLADAPDPVAVEQNLTYTATVTNTDATATANNVTLTDTLPASVNFVSGSAGCTHASGIVNCNLGLLAPGANTSVNIVVRPTQSGSLSNTVSTSSSLGGGTASTTTFVGSDFPSMANYVFTTTTDGSLTDISIGSTQLVGAGQDNASSTVQNIGFDFFFLGNPTRYTQFSANSNGSLRLGSTAISAFLMTPLTSGSDLPVITAFASNQATHSNGKVHFKTIGNVPNRILVVEWKNMRAFGTDAVEGLTYQVRLYESLGVIEFVYASMMMSANGVTSTTPQIGLISGTNPSQIGSVAAPGSGTPAPSYNGFITTSQVTNNSYAAGAIPVLDSAADNSRRVFRFTPPIPNAPSNVSFSNVGNSTLTANWTDNSIDESGFAVYLSSDGVNFTLAQTVPRNTATANVTGLEPSTNYTLRVFSLSESGVSNGFAEGVQTTLAASEIISITNGNWSSPSTWNTNTVPSAGDNVTIADGTNVTLDVSSQVFNLTVGQGNSGILQFSAAGFETLIAKGVNINTNATLVMNASFQTLLVRGNFTKNGTFNAVGGSVEFQGTQPQTLTGSTTVAFRVLTINNAAGVTLQSNASASVQLTFLNGRLTTGANTLEIAASGVTSNASSTRYVIGNLKRGFSANSSKTFNVGTLSGHSPVTVQSIAGSTYPSAMIVKAVEGQHPALLDQTKGIARYWKLTEENSLTANLTFTYLDSDLPTTVNEGSLLLFRFDGTSFTQIPATLNTASNTVTANGVTNFSDWTLAMPEALNQVAIRGRITTDFNGVTYPLAFVSVNLTGSQTATRRTDENGEYLFSVPNLGSYAIAPNFSAYTFAPAAASFTAPMTSPQIADFTATATQTLSGRIALQNATNISTMNANGSGLLNTVSSQQPPPSNNPSLTANSNPAFSRDGTKIVFARGAGNGSEIHKVSADGSGMSRLMINFVSDYAPAWSPDGNRIIFLRNRGSSSASGNDIFTMNADGTNQMRLDVAGFTATTNYGTPSFSPDGTKIIFSRLLISSPNRRDLFVVNTDGTNPIQLTPVSPDVFDSEAEFSPDGSKIAFLRSATATGAKDVFVMNADGSNQIELATDSLGSGGPTWSPDATKIAFLKAIAGSQLRQMVVMAADGTDQTNYYRGTFAYLSWSVMPSVALPAGSDVTVSLGNKTVRFPNGVTTPGVIEIIPIPNNVDGRVKFAFDIRSTAVFTPPIEICTTIPPAVAPTSGIFSALLFLHQGTDSTSSRVFSTRTICATVNSLSPFAIDEQIDPTLPGLSGTIVDATGAPVSGANVTLSGTLNLATQTNEGGKFFFDNLTPGGNYTVTPALEGYFFNPANGTFNNLTDNQAVVFTGAAFALTLGGRVTNSGGAGLSGVQMTLEGSVEQTSTTDANGNYSFTNLPYGGSYTVSPFSGPSTFAPATRVFDFLGGNEPAANFTISSAPPVPTVTVNDHQAAEGNTSTTPFTFNVSLSAPSSQSVTVNFNTQDSTATDADNDYEPLSGSITFMPGETTKPLPDILVNGDNQLEPDEQFTVNLNSATNATIADGVGNGTILNDDATVQFSSATYSSGEGDGNAVITITRVGSSLGAVGGTFSTTAGTATSNQDFSDSAQAFQFADGSTTPIQINVPILEDAIHEGSETVNLSIANVTGGATAGSPNTALLTIVDNDAQPTLSIGNVTQSEGTGGTTDFAFDVNLSGQSSQPVQVDFATQDGSTNPANGGTTCGGSGVDYESRSGTLVFPSANTLQTITIKVCGDTSVESDEAFLVNLSNPQNASIASGTGSGTIVNDDFEANLSVTKSDSHDPATEGNDLSYHLSVANAGPSNANNVMLIDTLPAGVTFVSVSTPACSYNSGPNTVTCGLGTLSSNGTNDIFITLTPGPSLTGTTISNSVSVSADEPDPNTSNNSATETTAIVAANCTQLPSDLISWWSADNNALDISGGNDGTLQNGATFAPGKVNQAFTFNGVNQYVDVGNVTLPSTFTIEAWVNPNSLAPATVIARDDGASNRSYYLQIEATGSLVGSVFNGSGFTQYRTSGNPVVAGSWQHIAMTYDGSAGPDQKMKFYVNGANFPAANISPADDGGSPQINSLSARIGIFGDGSAAFAGLIDELAVYQRMLSTAEVQSIYNASFVGKCRTCTTPPNDLDRWYPADGNANDIQSSINGTLQNGATASASGKVNQAFGLDGIDDYVEAPDSPLGSDFTIDAWVNFDTVNSMNALVAQSEGAGSRHKWIFWLNNGQLQIHLNDPSSNSRNIGNAPFVPTAGLWHHVAVTKNSNTYTFYVDGNVVGAPATDTSGFPDPTAPLTIGGAENQFFVDGRIDEVEVFNRSLSGQEIAAMVNAGNAGKCRPANTRPHANDDNYTVDEDTTLTVGAPGLLANDTDANSNPLTAQLVSGPSNAASFMLNADGSLTYTPNPNFFGTDSFTYTANDGNGGTDTATVNITVNSVNDAPVANSDAYSVNSNTTLVVPAPGVLANDTDIDGDVLSAVLVTNVSNGTLALASNGSFSYTPNPNFSGTETFIYSAFDGTANSNLATVQITVNASANKIVFSSNRDGNFEIYEMRADGTAVARLTNNGASDLDPSLSPDRTKIAFTSNRDGNFEIYVMNANGTGVTRLTNNSAIEGFAAWSPSGAKLAFTSTRDGNSEIYSMNADGTGVTRLTNHAQIDGNPAWSPDGNKIAFTSTRPGNLEIYLMNADGSGVTRLTTHGAEDAFPTWSPNGSQIAFMSTRPGNAEIYVMNANGTGVTRLTTHSAIDAEPAWNSGGKIAFTSTRDGNSEIYSMNANGTGVVRLTNHSSWDISPHW